MTQKLEGGRDLIVASPPLAIVMGQRPQVGRDGILAAVCFAATALLHVLATLGGLSAPTLSGRLGFCASGLAWILCGMDPILPISPLRPTANVGVLYGPHARPQPQSI